MKKINRPTSPKVGIIGAGGWVGSHMKEVFPEALCYDAFIRPTARDIRSGWVKSLSGLKDCSFVFVCVPTPPMKSGQCDTSIVEEVITELDNEMEKVLNDDAIFIIRSTVEPGTSFSIGNKIVRGIVFQPEYLGETQGHPMEFDFIILGGSSDDTNKVADLYKTVYNSTKKFYFSSATAAELCKYMENSFIATKVIFCNQFYDLAKALRVPYNILKELWLADERIGRWFTDVYPNKRGFDGKCLPKDTGAISAFAKKNGTPLKIMERVIEINKEYHTN